MSKKEDIFSPEKEGERAVSKKKTDVKEQNTRKFVIDKKKLVIYSEIMNPKF